MFLKSGGRPPGQRSPSAFTLIELIVVITIIGILGPLVAIKVTPVLVNANQTKIKHDLQRILDAAKMVQIQKGLPPGSMEEMVNATDGSGNEIVGLEEEPLDPWHHPYRYELRKGQPVAICLGRDNKEGGEGEDADWEWPWDRAHPSQ